MTSGEIMYRTRNRIKITNDTDYPGQYIKTLLLKDMQISNLKIKLRNNNQTVVIYGVVDSLWKRKKTLEFVSMVPAIITVLNRMRVLLRKGYDDKYIKGKVEKAIKNNTHITSDKIKVSVNKGVVSLTGTVKNRKEYREAYNCAFYTDDVIDIKNKLSKGTTDE